MEECDFWIRLINLPLNSRDSESLYRVASKVGVVIALDGDKVNSFRSSVRARVRVNVNKPLTRVVKVLGENNKILSIPVKYEKLPNYCYWCSNFWHVREECESIPESHDGKDWPYGEALRATPLKFKTVRVSEGKSKVITEEENACQPIKRQLVFTEEEIAAVVQKGSTEEFRSAIAQALREESSGIAGKAMMEKANEDYLCTQFIVKSHATGKTIIHDWCPKNNAPAVNDRMEVDIEKNKPMEVRAATPNETKPLKPNTIKRGDISLDDEDYFNELMRNNPTKVNKTNSQEIKPFVHTNPIPIFNQNPTIPDN
ncbi:hypothetical protein M5689_020230 [Euphorbia peplus]|nr:hypothetical protein M5689_020230 [Euphorbia peplus]